MTSLNLLIDFNNILMRALNVPGTTFYNSLYDNDSDIADIIKKITMDICYTVKLFNPNKVFILCDSANMWRKDHLPKDDTGYKANRKTDDTKDWNNLWKNIEIYKKILADFGFCVCSIPRCEADDLAALLKGRLFNDTKSSIIYVTSDADWRQLVDFNNNDKTFCAVFNPIVNNKGKKRLFLTDATQQYILSNTNDTSDIISQLFGDNIDISKNVLNKIITTDAKIETVCIDGFDVLIHKIFEGDDSDNVPSYYDYYKKTKRGTISTGVTPSQVKKLCESLNLTNIIQVANLSNEIKTKLEEIMKMELPVDAVDRLERQRILVELNPTLFPENIVSAFNNFFNSEYNKCINVQIIDLSWKDILRNSKFYDENLADKPITNAVFNDFGARDEFSKFFKSLF